MEPRKVSFFDRLKDFFESRSYSHATINLSLNFFGSDTGFSKRDFGKGARRFIFVKGALTAVAPTMSTTIL